jgi:hypothetical protein
MLIRPLIIVVVVGGLAAVGLAQDPPRQQGVFEEVARRQKLREELARQRGVVVAPTMHPDSWFAEPRDFSFGGYPLELCGPMLATLARKEVMISGAVAKKKITVSVGRVTAEKALEAFRIAIADQGIAIVPVGPRILALVDAADAPR